MKKTKFKQRIENARNAFFADETFGANDYIGFRNEDAPLRNEETEDFIYKNSRLETILKQVFLFFPGTFILYILSLGFTAMLISNLVRPSGMSLRFGIGWVMLLFLTATLMTWVGLGDVRKPKHFVIPASIISLGAITGALTFVLMTIPHYGRIFFRDSFAFYVFPLALIVPFLAKGWVDRNSEG